MSNTFDRLASLSRQINAQTHIDFNAMYDLKQKLWDLPNKVNSCQSEFEMLSGLAELEIGDSYFPKWQSRLIRSDDDYLKKMKIIIMCVLMLVCVINLIQTAIVPMRLKMRLVIKCILPELEAITAILPAM